MEQQGQDMKANISNPFAEWTPGERYPLDRTVADSEHESPDGPLPCIFCGRIHGVDDEDDNEGGTGDPVSAAEFEAKIAEALGAIFPGIPVQTTTAGDVALSVQDIIVVNAALQLTALTLSSVAAKRNGNDEAALQLTKIAIDKLNVITTEIGKGAYALDALSKLGERLLDVAQAMIDGRTVGLVVAPF